MYKINRYINDFENMEEIKNLSLNPNPNAIHILEKNPEKIYWCWLAENPSAIDLLHLFSFETPIINEKII